MKRILSILAVLALVAIAAQAYEVKSENVAGVYTKTLPANGGLIALAVQLDPFDGDQTLEGVLGVDKLRAEIGKSQAADNVYIWNGTGYDIYWLKDADGVAGGGDVAWVDSTGPTNPSIDSGSAFWIRSPNNQDNDLDITLTGEVIESTDVTTPINAGLQMMAYPFSSDVGVNNTDLINDGATQEAKGTPGDELFLWDPNTKSYTILKTVSGNSYWEVSGGDGSPSDDVIEMGEGVWYRAQNGYSWGETNAYLTNL